MKKTEVLINGGGVPGLCLAILLGRDGIPVTVCEQANYPSPSDIQPSGRTVALWQGSLNVLRAIGFDESLFSSFSSPLKIMRLIDDNSFQKKDPVEVEFKASDLALDCFGYNIPAGLLLAHVSQIASKTDNVEILTQTTIQDYNIVNTSIVASLSNNEHIQAKLIVGADGRNSLVREKSNIDIWKNDYGQSAMTFLINHSKDHKSTSTEFHRPGGPFTIVPLPGKQSSIVWAENTQDADKFMAMSKQDFTQAVQDRTNGIVGEIELANSPQSCPLIGLRAKSLISDRTALIAEAAHVISPIGAQGMNLSLRDTAILAEVIVDQRRLGMDIGSQYSLEPYARRRQSDVHSRVAMIDSFNRIVNNDLISLRGARRFGLKTIDAIPALKKMVMKVGLAPYENDGRLLSGQGL